MKILPLIAVGVSLLLAGPSASSHHAFASEFDVNRRVDLTGAITRMEWTNPHAWVYIATENAQGDVEQWAIELVGINDLLRLGWGRDRVAVGDVISIEGFGARNGSNTANAASVRIAETGELLWASVSRQEQLR